MVEYITINQHTHLPRRSSWYRSGVMIKYKEPLITKEMKEEFIKRFNAGVSNSGGLILSI
jgi:hypothetical protein